MRPPTLTKPMDLPGLATNCEESAKYYESNPGMTAHSGVVPDLYRTVAGGARLVPHGERPGRTPSPGPRIQRPTRAYLRSLGWRRDWPKALFLARTPRAWPAVPRRNAGAAHAEPPPCNPSEWRQSGAPSQDRGERQEKAHLHERSSVLGGLFRKGNRTPRVAC